MLTADDRKLLETLAPGQVAFDEPMRRRTTLKIGGPADAESPPAPTSEYVVASGDTLWSIAAGQTDPGEDVRVAITDIREASGLTGSGIYPGQILQIPNG